MILAMLFEDTPETERAIRSIARVFELDIEGRDTLAAIDYLVREVYGAFGVNVETGMLSDRAGVAVRSLLVQQSPCLPMKGAEASARAPGVA